MVERLSSYLPFAARQGSRAKYWLSFVALAVADAHPRASPYLESPVGATPSVLRALVRAAAAAVGEQAGALSNHPNAGLYAAIARLVPGAGHYLELEPCLVCHAEQGKRGKQEAEAGVPLLDSGSSPSALLSGAIAAAGGATGVGGASVSTGGGGGGGGGLVFLNYPLDSIKASSKSTENAMLVSFFIGSYFHPSSM